MPVLEGTPPRAKICGGVWLPDNETHFVEWMTTSKKKMEVGGKLTYQYHKLVEAMKHQPEDRRACALDIGAHVGLWSMHMVGLFDVVHAFEPCSLFYDIFPYNVDMDRCELHKVALGENPATIIIEVPRGQTGNAHVYNGVTHPGAKYGDPTDVELFEDVPMVRLDSFDLPRIDFVKIDVEGFEFQVLRGAEKLLLRDKPNVIVEQKGNERVYGQTRDEGKKYLESIGMKPLKVVSGDWIMGW